LAFWNFPSMALIFLPAPHTIIKIILAYMIWYFNSTQIVKQNNYLFNQSLMTVILKSVQVNLTLLVTTIHISVLRIRGCIWRNCSHTSRLWNAVIINFAIHVSESRGQVVNISASYSECPIRKFRPGKRLLFLMMEAVRTSKTSVDNYFTRQYIPEDNSELHNR
jgi:magnesium-transporting ATPase (P-type)